MTRPSPVMGTKLLRYASQKRRQRSAQLRAASSPSEAPMQIVALSHVSCHLDQRSARGTPAIISGTSSAARTSSRAKVSNSSISRIRAGEGCRTSLPTAFRTLVWRKSTLQSSQKRVQSSTARAASENSVWLAIPILRATGASARATRTRGAGGRVSSNGSTYGRRHRRVERPRGPLQLARLPRP